VALVVMELVVPAVVPVVMVLTDRMALRELAVVVAVVLSLLKVAMVLLVHIGYNHLIQQQQVQVEAVAVVLVVAVAGKTKVVYTVAEADPIKPVVATKAVKAHKASLYSHILK
jgi:hypothetical protein